MKLNRAELLQMALEGKVKKGDKFKDELDNTVEYSGCEFIWKHDHKSLTLFVHPTEYFTPVVVDKEVTITLKQSELNTLRVLTGGDTINTVLERNKSYGHSFRTITTGDEYGELFGKLNALVK